MAVITHLVLDVLKPHQPNALEFTNAIANRFPRLRVNLVVQEVDEKTESTFLTIGGDDINYDDIVQLISEMGASVHSIDEVEVVGDEVITTVG